MNLKYVHHVTARKRLHNAEEEAVRWFNQAAAAISPSDHYLANQETKNVI